MENEVELTESQEVARGMHEGFIEMAKELDKAADEMPEEKESLKIKMRNLANAYNAFSEEEVLDMMDTIDALQEQRYMDAAKQLDINQ